MVAFTLAALKSSNIKIAGIIATIVIITLISPLISINNSSYSEINNVRDENSPKAVGTTLTMKIIVDESYNGKSTNPNDNLDFNSKTLNPTIIIRGNVFTVSGRLIDNQTGLGEPDEPIYIFWEYFNWTDYYDDPSGFRGQYLIGQGSTNGTGHYFINCVDSSHSKSTGSGITVYAVYFGNPLKGRIEDNRQYISESIDCYAQALLVILDVGPSPNVRAGDSFYVIAGLGYDNYSLIDESIGKNITIEFLGSTYEETITPFGGINASLTVPGGTPIDNYYDVKMSFNISTLNLPYLVGNQISRSEIGTPAADWCNDTSSIYVFTGASVSFTITSPLPPGLGLYPEILRRSTIISISGTLANETGGSFGESKNLEVFVDSTNIIDVATEINGDFSSSFIINSTSFGVGTHQISVDVATGQGITAIIEYENITIVSNSTFQTPIINGTIATSSDLRVLPGEIIHVNGRIVDLYDGSNAFNIPVIAQWESFGAIYSTNTSVAGEYNFDIQVPLIVDPNLPNGTINIYSNESQYYTGNFTSFVVDVFTNLDFSITLNQTSVIEGATITTIGGNTLYTNSNFTFNLNLTDQFSRPLANRDILINLTSIIAFTAPTNANGMLSFDVNGLLLGFTNTTYTIILTFVDNPSSTFSFDLEISIPQIPTTGPTTPGTTTNGDTNLFNNLSIGILISVVSLIIIVAIIYGFGRFRRKGKQIPGDAAEVLNLPTIMKMMADAERAKDYQRAVVLCYRAFELICMQDLQIINARFLSPRELGYIVINTNRIPARDINLLVRRYEEARFSDHKIIKNAFTTSKQALENVQLALKAEPKKPK
jgi:hypothetical protein